jgi:tetratricopeptide (TPR) repeat protein
MALIGREEEVRVLERAVVCAAAKEGGVIVLSGEPGIGKTSLLRELELNAEARRFSVLSVRSRPRHLPDKELLWQHIWRGLSETGSPDVVGPAGAGGLPDPGPDRREIFVNPVRGVWDAQATAALFRSILESLIALARNCPLLVAIDDIHYADESSLKLLGFLSHSLDGLPVLLAFALSPCVAAGSETELMAEVLAGRGRGLEIGPLDEEATGQILCETIGFTPHQRIVRSVHHLAGGNPRFISECARVVSDLNCACPGKRGHFEIRIPSAVRVAIGERLKALSPEAGRVLKFGAVFSNGFEPELMSELADLDEAEAHAAISELRNAGLIRPVSGHSYDYTHGFTRELLYRELSVPRRSHLHRRIASALELNEAPEISGRARQIAQHLMRSGEPQTIERAVHYARFAARHFAGMRDFAKAAEMYALGIEGIEAQPSLDRGELCEMLTDLGEAQREAQEVELAQGTLFRAARLAQDLGDNERLVRIVLGMPDLGWPFADSPNGTALMLAQKALAAIPEDDAIEKALLTGRIAGEYSYLIDQRRHSELLFAEAIEMGRRAGSENQSMMLPVYVSRDRILRCPGLLDERLANADHIIQIACKAGDSDALFAAAFAKYCALCEIGGAASAQTQIALMQQAANLADRLEYRVVLIGLQAARALHRGRLDLAEQFCGEARRTANANATGSLADRFWPCLAVPLKEQGRLAELAALAEGICREQLCSYNTRALLCWLLFELSDTAQARSQLDLLATETFGDLKRGPYSTAAAALLGEVSAALKMPEYAAPLYDFLLPLKSRYVIVEPSCTPFGCVSRYLGKLALALSNFGQAVAHFEEAVHADRKIGARTWTAYSLVELARSLLIRSGTGEHERANEILREARREAVSLQMHQLVEEISRLQGRSGNENTTTLPDSGGRAVDCQAQEKGVEGALQAQGRLRREAGSWRLTFEGRTVHVKELRGLTQIAHLLSRPNEPVNAVELAFLGRNGQVIVDPTPASDLGPVLDDDAKRAYRVRVRQLDEELEEARSSGNEQAALKIEEELCFLTREIARAVGLFGRDRRAGSEVERARVRVTNSIKFAIGRIAEDHPTLGAYFQKTIRTGANCSYIVQSGVPVTWDLDTA